MSYSRFICVLNRFEISFLNHKENISKQPSMNGVSGPNAPLNVGGQELGLVRRDTIVQGEYVRDETVQLSVNQLVLFAGKTKLILFLPI